MTNRNIFLAILMMGATLTLSLKVNAQTVTVTYSNPGTHSATIPAGATNATGQAWGGGGGGGGARCSMAGGDAQAGGGGAGGYVYKSYGILSTTNSLSIVVGKGGAGGCGACTGTLNTRSDNGKQGDASSINNTTAGIQIVANFGNGGGKADTWTSNTYGRGGLGGEYSNGDGGTLGNDGGTMYGGGNPNGGAQTANPGNGNYNGFVGNAPCGGGSGARIDNSTGSQTGGNGANGRVVITFDLPQPTFTVSSPVCSGKNITFTITNYVSGVTYYLYKNSNDLVATFSGSTHTTTAEAGSYTVRAAYSISQSGGTLSVSGSNITNSGNTVTVTSAAQTVTVNQTPDISGQSKTVCSGEAFSFGAGDFAGAPTNTTFSWPIPVLGQYVGGSPLVADSNQSAIAGTLTNGGLSDLATVTYTVTPTNAGCQGNPFTLTITVQTYPDINKNFTPTICSGDAFSVNPVHGTDGIVTTSTLYTWTVVSADADISGASAQTTPVKPISQTLTNTGTINETVVYNVVAKRTSDGTLCPAKTSAFTVTVTVKPNISISGATTVTEGHTLSLSANLAGGTWSSSNTSVATIAPVDASSSLLTAIVAGHTTVSYTLNGCSATYEIDVLPDPADRRICVGVSDSILLTGSSQAGAWLSDNGSIVTITQTGYMTGISIGQTIVRCTSSGGAVTPITVIVTGKPTVTPLSTLPFLCSGKELNITAPSVEFYGAATQQTHWELRTVGQPVQITPVTMPHLLLMSNSGQDLYFIATNECGKDSTHESLIVNQTPIIHDLDTTICSGNPVTLTPLNGIRKDTVTMGTLYWWDRGAYPNIDGSSATIGGAWSSDFSQTLTNTSTTPSTITYYLYANLSNNCFDTATYRVTVNPIAIIASNRDTVICSGDTFKLQPHGTDIVPTNTTYTWTISTPNINIRGASENTTGSSTMSQMLENFTEDNQTITYSVTATTGAAPVSCVNSTPITVNVTVRPQPRANISLGALNGGNEICEGENCKLRFTGTPDFTLNYTVNGYVPSTYGLGTTFGLGGGDYTLTPGQGQTYEVIIPAGLPGTFHFELQSITDGNGCVNSKQP